MTIITQTDGDTQVTVYGKTDAECREKISRVIGNQLEKGTATEGASGGPKKGVSDGNQK